MDTNLMPKNAEKFYCKICDFKCCKQSNYDAHILTAKHKKIQKDTIKIQKNAVPQYVCDCGRLFAYHSGLWRHKKKCNDEKEL